MNTIIEENNVDFEKILIGLLGWREIQKHKIKTYFLKSVKTLKK